MRLKAKNNPKEKRFTKVGSERRRLRFAFWPTEVVDSNYEFVRIWLEFFWDYQIYATKMFGTKASWKFYQASLFHTNLLDK